MDLTSDKEVASLILAMKTHAKIAGQPTKSAYLVNKQFDRVWKIRDALSKRPGWPKIQKFLADHADDCVAMWGISDLMDAGTLSAANKRKYLERAVIYVKGSGLAGLLWGPMLHQNGVNLYAKNKPDYRGD